MVRVFPKSASQTKEMAPTICNSIPRNYCRLIREWNATGRQFSSVPFRTEKEGVPLEVVYNFQTDFSKKSSISLSTGFFCWIVSTLIFRKIHYRKLWKLYTTYRGSPFLHSERNSGNFLIICLISQFPVSHQPKTIANAKCHLVGLVCWFWKNCYHYSPVIPTGLFWQMVNNPNFLETRRPNTLP